MIGSFQSASRPKARRIPQKFYKQSLDRESFFGHFLLNFVTFFPTLFIGTRLSWGVWGSNRILALTGLELVLALTGKERRIEGIGGMLFPRP